MLHHTLCEIYDISERCRIYSIKIEQAARTGGLLEDNSRAGANGQHGRLVFEKEENEVRKKEENKNLEEIVYNITRSVWNVNSLANPYTDQIIKMSRPQVPHLPPRVS